MQIKEFLTSLWDKIICDESGQLSSFATPIRTVKSIQAMAAYLKRQAALKKSKEQPAQVISPTTEPIPEQMFKSKVQYPTSELTLSSASHYDPNKRPPPHSIFRDLPEAPKVTPLVVGTAEPPSPEDPKELIYLKEYVRQMRAADFPDYFIRKKLLAVGRVFIPNELPANFGQTGEWATGMADEFKGAMQKYRNEQTSLLPEDIIANYVPSPDEYLNYMQGGTASRMPSYSEYRGQDTSPYYDPSGKFSQAKQENLRDALVNYMTSYQGKTLPFNQGTMEAGVGGYPVELGQQYYQEFLSLAEQKAEEIQLQKEYEEETRGQQDIYKGELDRTLKEAQSLVDKWQGVKSEGGQLFTPIQDTDDKGNVIDYDPLDLIIRYIRSGESIENIAAFINSNNIPITNYQLQGLYYLYGQ